MTEVLNFTDLWQHDFAYYVQIDKESVILISKVNNIMFYNIIIYFV